MSDLTTLLTRAQEISSDAERVTQAHLRKVTLPSGTGVIGLITLDNGEDHTKPNTFGPRSLLALNDAIDAALADDEITAIGVTGKPFILAAGADLTSIAGGGPDARPRRRRARPRGVPQARPRGARAASRRSASSTASPSAVASRSRCTAPTAP